MSRHQEAARSRLSRHRTCSQARCSTWKCPRYTSASSRRPSARLHLRRTGDEDRVGVRDRYWLVGIRRGHRGPARERVRGRAAVLWNTHGFSYSVDWDRMQQVNEKTGSRRGIRRSAAGAPSPDESSSSDDEEAAKKRKSDKKKEKKEKKHKKEKKAQEELPRRGRRGRQPLPDVQRRAPSCARLAAPPRTTRATSRSRGSGRC